MLFAKIPISLSKYTSSSETLLCFRITHLKFLPPNNIFLSISVPFFPTIALDVTIVLNKLVLDLNAMLNFALLQPQIINSQKKREIQVTMKWRGSQNSITTFEENVKGTSLSRKNPLSSKHFFIYSQLYISSKKRN